MSSKSKKESKFKDMPPWLSAPTQKEIEENVGFIYEIINHNNNRYYIGQCKFHSNRTLPPLKGKRRKRHVKKESNWREYWGSCKELHDDIEKYEGKGFTREVLIVCKSKAWMNFYETKAQFDRSVLLDPLSYNGIINCRISSNQLRMKK